MNEYIFYEKLSKLNQEYHDAEIFDKEQALLAMESLLKKQLKLDPQNTELWIRLALVELTPPLLDYNLILSYLNKVLSIDPNHFDALMLLAYLHIYYLPVIPDELFKKLSNLKVEDVEQRAMIELMKAEYYEQHHNDKMHVRALLAAIDYVPSFVAPYINLGHYYDGKNKEKSRRMYIQGLKNIKLVYNENYDEDITDIQFFYDDNIKKTIMYQRIVDQIMGYIN